MILGVTQKPVELASQQPSAQLGNQFAFSRRCIHMATICLAVVGVVSIAPSALSQGVARSTATVQHSTCASDPQGSMCSSQRELDSAATPQTVAMLPALSDAQMEQLSDVLLGLLYFVLPIGFGIGLFIHDRHQAERAAALEAQIKLLEKLWEQSPQA
jgi:hypothetical protein